MPPMFDSAREKELARRVFNDLYSEDYWDKLSRIASSPNNRIFRTDHDGMHKTSYVLALIHPEDGPIFMPVRCETMSMMEVVKDVK